MMRCPHCHGYVRIGIADQQIITHHWRELAGAFEQRGEQLMFDLVDARRLISELQDLNVSLDHRMETYRRENEVLRDELNEFKAARSSRRRVA